MYIWHMIYVLECIHLHNGSGGITYISLRPNDGELVSAMQSGIYASPLATLWSIWMGFVSSYEYFGLRLLWQYAP